MSIKKSLEAVDKLLKEEGREYVDKIFNEVMSLDIDGTPLEFDKQIRVEKILSILNSQMFDVVSYEITLNSILYTAKVKDDIFFLEDYLDETDYVILSSYIGNVKQTTTTGSLNSVIEKLIKNK